EAVHPNAPIERDGYKQVYSINAKTITDVTGVEGLSTAFVQLSEDQLGGLFTIPLPSMDRGNHLSYVTNGLPLESWLPSGWAGLFIPSSANVAAQKKNKLN